MFPSGFVLRLSRSLGSATLFVSFLVGLSLVIGWVSYSSIYPLWKRIITAGPLRKLGLFPESAVQRELSEALKLRKITTSPERVWSYFLWRYCPEPIRDRVKGLADYGHSLYLVSCALILMPILYIIARLLRGPYSVLSWLAGNLLSTAASAIIAGEATVLVVSMLLGAYLLLKGRERIGYAHDLQQLLYQEQHQELERMLQALTPKELTSIPEATEGKKK